MLWAVVFLALATIGQAQCNGTVVALSDPSGGTVVAPPEFATADCQWSVQTDIDHYLEITITDFFVDSTPPFCQDLPGFPLVDSYSNQPFACAQVNPFCEQDVVAELCPQTCFLCDSCFYNYISMQGIDGVEYFRDCQTIALPLAIDTQVQNVLISSSRKFLSNAQPEFGISQDRFSFSYRPIPKGNHTHQSYRCTGTQVLTTDNGTFTDGSTPNAPYRANANCSWEISAPPGQFVELTFEQFELQSPSQYDMLSSQKRCTSDVLSIVDGSSSSPLFLGQYCGTTFPPVTVSSGRNLTVMFTADASVERLGFTASYRFVDVGSVPPIQCNSNFTFNNETGEANVVSGLDDTACSWTIIPPADKFVRIEFLTHSLTPLQPECLQDNITISQGTTVLLKSCDQYLPPAVTSTLNGTAGTLSVSFKTAIQTFEYFHFVWTFVDVPNPVPTMCSGNKNITAGVNATGQISDGTIYGVPYNSNTLCKWTITAPTNYIIRLDYDFFSLEPATGCIYDNVTVYSGDGTTLVQRVCGASIPVHVQSTANVLVVVFYSDIQLNMDGFAATWSVVPRAAYAAPCGGIVNIDGAANPTGNISSLSTYSAVRNCSWVITAPAGQYIKLEVLSLNLFPRELGYEVCYSESLSVWDGNSTDAYMLFQNCGTESVPVQVSTGNTVLVTYSAAMEVKGGGFTLQYTVVGAPGNTTNRFCGGLQTLPINPDDDNGTIVNYKRGELYRPNSLCEYVITAPAGKYIQLTWDYFGLQDPNILGLCQDFIVVRDGDNNSAPELQRSCGFFTPLPTTTTQPKLYVLFRSDELTQSYGFIARWEVVDRPGGIYDCSGNRSIYQTPVAGQITDGSDGYGYVNNAYCSWLITAPLNLVVEIKLVRVGLEASKNNVCRDYVQITDGKNKRAQLCGNMTKSMLDSNSFVSTTDKVLIEFSSDANNAGPGFLLTYAFVPRPDEDLKYGSRVELVVAVVLLSFFGVVLLCCVFVWYRHRQAAQAVAHIDLTRGQDLRKRTISDAPATTPAAMTPDDVETTGPQPID